MTHPAIELEATLAVAARQARMHGMSMATDDQIATIVGLCRYANDYSLDVGHVLSRSAAQRLIDDMFDAGGEWVAASKEEVAARKADKTKIARDKAARKVAKKQDKQAKTQRDVSAAEAARKVEGRRVRHAKFGEGTVTEEDERVATVIFDSQNKILRMAHQVLEAI